MLEGHGPGDGMSSGRLSTAEEGVEVRPPSDCARASNVDSEVCRETRSRLIQTTDQIRRRQAVIQLTTVKNSGHLSTGPLYTLVTRTRDDLHRGLQNTLCEDCYVGDRLPAVRRQYILCGIGVRLSAHSMAIPRGATLTQSFQRMWTVVTLITNSPFTRVPQIEE